MNDAKVDEVMRRIFEEQEEPWQATALAQIIDLVLDEKPGTVRVNVDNATVCSITVSFVPQRGLVPTEVKYGNRLEK